MAARSGDVGTRLRVVSLALTSSDRSKGRCDVQEMPPEVPKAQPKSRGSALTPRRLLLLGFLVLLVGFSTVAMRESLSDSVFPGDGITVTLVDESTVRESRELTYLVALCNAIREGDPTAPGHSTGRRSASCISRMAPRPLCAQRCPMAGQHGCWTRTSHVICLPYTDQIQQISNMLKNIMKRDVLM